MKEQPKKCAECQFEQVYENLGLTSHAPDCSKRDVDPLSALKDKE